MRSLARTILLLALGIGLGFALLSLWPGAVRGAVSRQAMGVGQRLVLASVLPGLLVSKVIAGEGGAGAAWAVAVGNFLFYFFLCWGTGQAVVRLFGLGKRVRDAS